MIDDLDSEYASILRAMDIKAKTEKPPDPDETIRRRNEQREAAQGWSGFDVTFD